MAWDFAEMNSFAGSAGDWAEAVRYLGLFVEANITPSSSQGTTAQSSATRHPMPDDSTQALCTDPPYYDAIAYGDLSDFFYVWLRRILSDVHPSLFSARLTNKDEEIVQQLDLFKVLEQADGAETASGEAIVEHQGKTVLDRIHQSMILFAAGRSEALKRFLVEEGVGRDPRFWSLAQALSALYPTHTTEKRWIDGVLARKKGLGF
jgi:adenine-specific DNA methylase